MDIKPTTSKKELLKRTDNYFSVDENSWMPLDDFIETNCPNGYRENKGWVIGVANYLQNTAKYIYEIQDVTGFYIIKPSPSYKWDKLNLVWNKIKLIGITALISGIIPTATALYLHQSNTQLPTLKDTQQDTIINNLSGDIKKLQGSVNAIQNSLSKHDTTTATPKVSK